MDLTKESFDKRIACVIVTYNRKQLLKRCLDAVSSQTFKPSVVYITDNASTDGTIDSVKEWGYYECMKEGIQFKYILNSKNEGGAGGFYLGMKTAYEDNSYDGIWVMDDDGEPEKNCLHELQKHIDKNDYIAPFVIAEEDNNICAFIEEESVESFFGKAHNGIVYGVACPFNGILYSSRLVQKIGFPKREMFIWGDELNYHIRACKAGYTPITVINAIHYHPKDRQKRIKGVFGSKVTVIEQRWKWYCFCRNLAYNKVAQYGHFLSLLYIFIQYFKYSIYLISNNNFDFFLLMHRAFFHGYVGNFSRLDYFMSNR